MEAEEKERNKRKEEEEKILADKLKQEKALAEEKHVHFGDIMRLRVLIIGLVDYFNSD